MAIVSQFAFGANEILAWDRHLRDLGINLPVHLGIAGPAILQTAIKFAIACGVGASLSVLQKRARDVTRLPLPFEPDELLANLSAGRGACNESLIEKIHVFPLGGIGPTCDYLARHKASRDGVVHLEKGTGS